ncbi:MAG: hypothetical protein KA354_20340 [Phycisphaerae bacterium]|nr:hypothetical protein [Phycisphaerae bacterium]
MKLHKPANRLCTVLNLATLVLVVIAQYRTLTDIRPFAFVGMTALLVSTMIAGWLLGGACRDARTAMVLATSVRNVGVGLVVATSSFAGTPAVTAALAYGLFQTVIMALVAVIWGRWGMSKTAISGAAVA